MSTTIPILRVPLTALLPDRADWTNRFGICSSPSDRGHVIAQNKSGRYWGCSCQSWSRHRTCGHLTALRLPSFEKAYEVALRASADTLALIDPLRPSKVS
jgi:hypothetical protein